MKLNIGSTIRTLRKHLAMNQEALADALGVSAAAVSKWESGKSYPDIELLPVLARKLDTTVDHLLDFTSCAGKAEQETIFEQAYDELEASLDQGIAFCEACIIRYPNDVELRMHLGTMIPMYAFRQPEEQQKAALQKALEWCMPASESTKHSIRSSALHMMANIYIMLEQYDLAEQSIRQTIGGPHGEFDPTLAVILMRKGEYDKAQDMYQRCLFNAVNDCTNALTGLSGAAGKLKDEARFLACEKAILAICDLFYGDSMSDAKMSPYLSLCHFYGKKREEGSYIDSLERLVTCMDAWGEKVDLSDNSFFFCLTSGDNMIHSSMMGDGIREIAASLTEYSGWDQQPHVDALIQRLNRIADKCGA